MKNKRHFVEKILIVFIISLCLFTMSCGKRKSSNADQLHVTNVKRTDLAEYGHYVYCSFDKVYRFNRSTEKLMTACIEPECEGDCPVDCVSSFFAGIHDERLYFIAYQQFTHNILLAYQNIGTGETGVIKTMSSLEEGDGAVSFVEDGYWYYMCKILKSGGDATVTADYESYICRISLDGSKDVPILKCENSEILCMVGGGKILTNLNGIIYATDIESKEKRELFDPSANGYTTIVNMNYLNNKIYFIARSNQTQPVEYVGGTSTLTYLVQVDLQTGKADRVVEEAVANFCLTDDAIYYAPLKLRYLYVPEDYEEHPENVRIFSVDETLYTCDLSGKNCREIYTNESLYYTTSFTVIDGVLYGWIQDYDEEAHWWERKTYFGAIEFDTGRVVRTERPQ